VRVLSLLGAVLVLMGVSSPVAVAENRAINFTSGAYDDDCRDPFAASGVVADGVGAGERIRATATMTGPGSNDFYFRLSYVPLGSVGRFAWEIMDLRDVGRVTFARTLGTYTPLEIDFTAPFDGQLLSCRSSSEDGPVGHVSGTISDGEPDAEPSVQVSGTTARLTALNPVNGANQFNWVITENGVEVTSTSGPDAEVVLPPGTYEAGLSVCRTSPDGLACRISVHRVPFEILGELVFDVQPVANAPLSRFLSVRPLVNNTTYQWSVDGVVVGGGGKFVWTAPSAGSYQVTLTASANGRSRSVSKIVNIGHTIEVDNLLSSRLAKGAVADPTSSCDGERTVLTVTSEIGVWAEIATSYTPNLAFPPQPGTTVRLGLLPPNGAATWTGGCFNTVPQSFQVQLDIASDRALAATAFAGFLSTISGGQIDANAIGRALSLWDNAAAWPLVHSRAAVDEFTQVLLGRGRIPVALGHVWAALTEEPEATRLRDLVFASGGAIPGIGDLASLAESATKAWQGLGLNPYEFGSKITGEQLKSRLRAAQELEQAAQQQRDDADSNHKDKQAKVNDITTQIADKEAQIEAKRDSWPNCSRALPAAHPCFRTQRRIESQVTKLRNEIKRLRKNALPQALTRLEAATERLTKATTALESMTTAVRNLDFAAKFVGQLTAIIELSATLYDGRRTGVITYRTQ
jgi:hypothetical protein